MVRPDWSLPANQIAVRRFDPSVTSLDSCVTHLRITHRYFKDKTTEKREKKETVLQSTMGVQSFAFV